MDRTGGYYLRSHSKEAWKESASCSSRVWLLATPWTHGSVEAEIKPSSGPTVGTLPVWDQDPAPVACVLGWRVMCYCSPWTCPLSAFCMTRYHLFRSCNGCFSAPVLGLLAATWGDPWSQRISRRKLCSSLPGPLTWREAPRGVTSQAAPYASTSLLRGSSMRRVWLKLGEWMASEWDPNTSVAVSTVWCNTYYLNSSEAFR